MASIISCPFSFVRFEPVDDFYCQGEAKYILPNSNRHEVKFQFLVDGYIPEDDAIKLGYKGTPLDGPIYAELVDYKYRMELAFYTAGSSFTLISFAIGTLYREYNKLVTWEEFLQILLDDFGIEAYIDEGDPNYLVFPYGCKLDVEFKAQEPDHDPVTMDEVEYFWNQGYVAAPDEEIEDNSICRPVGGEYGQYDVCGPATCFYYTLHHEQDDDAILGSTNEFYRLTDLCFTSLLTYWCNENYADFNYQSDRKNQVRLPISLSRPVHPQKRSVYITSKGRQKLLSANAEKEYQLETDWMIELFHECMVIALLHDNIILKNDNIREKTVEILSSEYNAEWNNEFNLIEAPGKGKVKVATFGQTNNNCESSDDDCSGSGACGLPTNLQISDIESDTATASWDAVDNASAYEIFVATDAEPPISPDGYPKIITTTSHDFEGLVPGTAWTWKVRAICGTEESAWVDGPDFETTE